MSVSTAWPPSDGGQPSAGLLPDFNLLLPLHSSSQERQQAESPPLHPLLANLGAWPIAESVEQVADEKVATEEVVVDGFLSQQPSPAPEPLLASSASSSHPLDGESDPVPPVEFEVVPSRNICVELPSSTLVHPKSQYQGYTPPLPPSRERDAVSSLRQAAEAQGIKPKAGFIDFELDTFSFYINAHHYPHEMRLLQHMTTRVAHDKFYFDGVLSIGGVRHYVQKAEVLELPIGNYGTTHATTEGQIWIRSKVNGKKEVYYRLGKPSEEYARFFATFLWVADLAKHVVDYSAARIEQSRPVALGSFRADFSRWLLKTHGKSLEFRRWRQKHPSDDYCTAVVANIDFIWKEMNGVLGRKKATSLQLFRETIYFSEHKRTVLNPLPMVVQRRRDESPEHEPPTIVTPYIKDCFGHMVLGKMLRAIDKKGVHDLSVPLLNGAPKAAGTPSAPVRIPSSKRTRTSAACFLSLEALDQIQAGDTISTPRDGETTDTKWRSMASKGAADDDRWFGLVQQVHIAKDGSRAFDVIWFYRPVETPCCMMKYPWPNELFLSDHCTCEDGRGARVKEHEVLGVHNINWLGSPDDSRKGEFFVRQTYMAEGRRWVTLQQAHKTCSHDSQRLGFRTGDTVLAPPSSSSTFTEPYEVVKIFKQNTAMFVRLRRLLRRRQVDRKPAAAPNELVYTDQLVVVKVGAVVGNCQVRFFRPGQKLPTPYDRGGTGNLFFITHRLEAQPDGTQRCVPFEDEFPASLRQGLDPTRQTFRKLKGMDLFCGSGNFGRGLEEGGGIDMLWANDIWDRAIHTYMANSPDANATKPFLGSVDDLLRLALEGKYADNVPRPGEVDFISAGSPCPGFSLLTQDKTTLNQIKNQSLVASFASFVDFYRPKYGILENVSTIVQARHNRSEDVLSQLFCAIVGMGYQAQLILGDAWSHGAPQCRNRVFLYFAAPGLRLPDPPPLTHSHFPGTKSRGLGEMCNGEPFVRRSFSPTPFPYLSAGAATADLPRIDDGKAEAAAPSFPDHRVCAGLTSRLRYQIAAIPTRPRGLGFSRAWRKGLITPAERELLFPAEGSFRVTRISTAWSRVDPGQVFPTITTRSQPTDARAGTGLHWDEGRPLTVQEIRRAQGFPDGEVLLGPVVDQWKLVGNSVARQMAVALGVKFREAWAGSVADGGSGGKGLAREMSGSGSVASSVRAGGGERRVQRVGEVNGQHRQSTPREIMDLTMAPDVREETVSDQDSASRRNIIDLTAGSRLSSPSTGTSQDGSSPAKITRKRTMSHSLGPEIEEQQRAMKVIRLDDDDDEGSGPVSAPAPAPAPAPVEKMGAGPGGAGKVGMPTVVRLPTPDGMCFEGE